MAIIFERDETEIIQKVTPDRFLALYKIARERNQTNYWLWCSLCLGYTTFTDEEDLRKAKRRESCRCSHRFTRDTKEGTFPRGTVLVWEEEDEL